MKILSSVLLVLLTFLMCGVLFSALNFDAVGVQNLPFSGPAKIEVIGFSGGDRYNDSVRFQDNILILKHAGGDAVLLNSTAVLIKGIGNAYAGIPGSDGSLIYGDMTVFYENLDAGLKNSDFEKNNEEMLKDGVWSAGEFLVLTGNDSLNSSASSVFVTADGQNKTSNNYGFSSGQTAEIQIYRQNKSTFQMILKTGAEVFKNK